MDAADTAPVVAAEAPPDVSDAAPTQDTGPQPNDAQQGAQATEKAPPKTFRMKVNGQEREIAADQAEAITRAAQALGVDPDELLNGVQIRNAGFEKFREAQKLRSETEALLQNLKGAPAEALRRAGIDPREWAKQEILKAIEDEKREQEEASLPPHIREALQRARQLEEEHGKLKAEREQAQKGQLDAAAKAHFERWNAELPKAMEAAGLPRTPEATRIVLAKMQVMAKAGMPVDPAWAAKSAARELEERNFSILRSMPPERIVAAIGKDAYDKLLKHSIASAKGTLPQPLPAQAQPAQPQGRKHTALSAKEWDREFGV